MNVFQAPLEALRSLFLERFSLRGLLHLLFQIFIIVLVAYLIESMGGFLFYRSTEKQVTLLKELKELSDDDINQNPELYPIYQDTLQELEDHEILTIPKITDILGGSLTRKKTSSTVQVLKFLTGGWLGIIVIFRGLAEKRQNKPTWANSILVGAFVGSIFGLIGILIPTFVNPVINYVGYPILQVVGTYLASKVPKKKEQESQ